MRPTVDARGLACPQPVVLTSKAIATADQLTVIVDNPVAAENVSRLARSKGFAVDRTDQPDSIHLVLHREGQPIESPEEPPCSCAPLQGKGTTVVFVPSDAFGRGPAELGERLMGAFFHTLLEVRPRPKSIILMNTGVKLAVEGSRVIEDMRALAAQGVEVLACGTCLSYFELTDRLAVGRVSNMYDIASALLEADKVVEL